MDPRLRNIIAAILGILVGGVVNGGLIALSPILIPPPEGVDMTTPEGINAGLELLSLKHWLMPFLAHALGTLVGAFVCYKIAASHHLKLALLIGFFFLFGGIVAAIMIKAPMWFIILDLVLAYLPMAYLGANFARNKKQS